MYSSTLSITSALDVVGGQLHAPVTLPPEKTRYTLYTRLGGLQVPPGWVRKISSPPGFDPRTVQPVESRYTDWAIPALDNACVLVASQGISCVLQSVFKYTCKATEEKLKGYGVIGFKVTLFRCPFAALLSRLSRSVLVWVISLLLLRGHVHYRREGSKFGFRLCHCIWCVLCAWELAFVWKGKDSDIWPFLCVIYMKQTHWDPTDTHERDTLGPNW